MRQAFDIIKSLVLTEKSSQFEPLRKYLFWVDKKANKVEIKNAVQNIYKVKVESVNTIIAAGKLRKVRYQIGHTPDWKKAIVTLKEGNKIEVK